MRDAARSPVRPPARPLARSPKLKRHAARVIAGNIQRLVSTLNARHARACARARAPAHATRRLVATVNEEKAICVVPPRKQFCASRSKMRDLLTRARTRQKVRKKERAIATAKAMRTRPPLLISTRADMQRGDSLARARFTRRRASERAIKKCAFGSQATISVIYKRQKLAATFCTYYKRRT